MKRSSENWDFWFSDDLFDWWERCGVILRKCSKYSSSQSGKPTKTLPIPLGSKLLPIGKFICIFFQTIGILICKHRFVYCKPPPLVMPERMVFRLSAFFNSFLWKPHDEKQPSRLRCFGSLVIPPNLACVCRQTGYCFSCRSICAKLEKCFNCFRGRDRQTNNHRPGSYRLGQPGKTKTARPNGLY